MTDFADEQAAKIAAIREARNSKKPCISAEEMNEILKADIERAQAAIDELHKKARHAG